MTSNRREKELSFTKANFVSESSLSDLKFFSILTLVPFGAIFLKPFIQKASGKKKESLGIAKIKCAIFCVSALLVFALAVVFLQNNLPYNNRLKKYIGSESIDLIKGGSRGLNYDGDCEISFKSADPEIATVSKKGVIKAKKKGKTEIIATVKGQSVSIPVTVNTMKKRSTKKSKK